MKERMKSKVERKKKNANIVRLNFCYIHRCRRCACFKGGIESYRICIMVSYVSQRFHAYRSRSMFRGVERRPVWNWLSFFRSNALCSSRPNVVLHVDVGLLWLFEDVGSKWMLVQSEQKVELYRVLKQCPEAQTRIWKSIGWNVWYNLNDSKYAALFNCLPRGNINKKKSKTMSVSKMCLTNQYKAMNSQYAHKKKRFIH